MFGSSSKQILSKIEEIKNNQKEYEIIKINFENYHFKTVEQMQEEYERMYQESGEAKNQSVCTQKIDDLQRKTDVYDLRILRINLEANLKELQDYKNRYNFLVERFQKKQNTKIWQLAKKVKRFLKKK